MYIITIAVKFAHNSAMQMSVPPKSMDYGRWRIQYNNTKRGFLYKTAREQDLEFFMKRFYIILHALYQLRLIFPDGSADMRPNKQSIEPREDSKHLVGIAGRAQLVTQACGDTSFHTINALFIPTHKTHTYSNPATDKWQWTLRCIIWSLQCYDSL